MQRQFTKKIYTQKHMAHHEKLKMLEALNQYNKRLFADMVLVFKSIHQLNIKCSMKQLGLVMATSNTRGGNLCLIQKWLGSGITTAHFCDRISIVWIRQPINVIIERTLTRFKRKLHSFLMAKQLNSNEF